MNRYFCSHKNTEILTDVGTKNTTVSEFELIQKGNFLTFILKEVHFDVLLLLFICGNRDNYLYSIKQGNPRYN